LQFKSPFNVALAFMIDSSNNCCFSPPLLRYILLIHLHIHSTVYFQINHPAIEDEYKNIATFRPFRISLRYFFLQPFVLATFFVLFYSQFERKKKLFWFKKRRRLVDFWLFGFNKFRCLLFCSTIGEIGSCRSNLRIFPGTLFHTFILVNSIHCGFFDTVVAIEISLHLTIPLSFSLLIYYFFSFFQSII
jgi:hypothetical protein